MSKSDKYYYSSSLQSLKGIATLMVFLSHALLMYSNKAITRLHESPLHFFFDGQCAVVIFFCITGYFTFKERPLTTKGYWNHIAKKIVRIYPPYILVSVFACIMCNCKWEYNVTFFTSWSNSFWHEEISVGTLLKALLLIVPFDTNILNPPTWYIQVDMRMAFLLPILTTTLLFLNKYKPIGLLFLCLTLSILQPAFGLMFLPYYGGGIFLNIC